MFLYVSEDSCERFVDVEGWLIIGQFFVMLM